MPARRRRFSEYAYSISDIKPNVNRFFEKNKGKFIQYRCCPFAATVCGFDCKLPFSGTDFMYIRSVYTFFVYVYAEKSFIGVFGSISRWYADLSVTPDAVGNVGT